MNNIEQYMRQALRIAVAHRNGESYEDLLEPLYNFSKLLSPGEIRLADDRVDRAVAEILDGADPPPPAHLDPDGHAAVEVCIAGEELVKESKADARMTVAPWRKEVAADLRKKSAAKRQKEKHPDPPKNHSAQGVTVADLDSIAAGLGEVIGEQYTVIGEIVTDLAEIRKELNRTPPRDRRDRGGEIVKPQRKTVADRISDLPESWAKRELKDERIREFREQDGSRLEAILKQSNTVESQLIKENGALWEYVDDHDRRFLELYEEIGRLRTELQTARGASGWRGVWQAAGTYQRGETVTYGGTLWFSHKSENTDKPGTSDAWQLMVKSNTKG